MNVDFLENVIDCHEEVIKDDNGNLKSIKVITRFQLDEESIIIGIGIAKVHPDDFDLATIGVGINIASMRSNLDALDKILDFAMTEEHINHFKKLKKETKESLDYYILAKENFYQKVRMKRIDPDHNKIKHFVLNDDGKSALEVE